MNRRNFIKNLGALSGSFALNIQGVSVNAAPHFLSLAANNDTGKILVLIQLFGGNDGLNTIIPFEDDFYHENRPTLRKKKKDVLEVGQNLGFNSQMRKFYDLFQEGKVSVIQNVGYENPDRSHFRSTDIWKTATDSNQYSFDGWAGRYLEKSFIDSFENPSFPMAIELGWSGSLLLENNNKSLGLYMNSPDEYHSLINNNNLSEFINLESKAGDALKYINTIAKNSFKFSSIIKEVSDSGKNLVFYPDSFLGKQLAIIAKLISGGIKTPVFVAKLKGFDTHFSQAGTHDLLLNEVSEAVGAFQKDIETQKFSEKVSTLIFSEFGRRVRENASGTDHGTAAPIFVVGSTVRGGIIGRNPNFQDLDKNGDLKFKYDFRQVYSTMLKDHLSVSETNVNSILYREFTTLPIYKDSIPSFPQEIGMVGQNFPNPAKALTTINYFLTEGLHATILLYDTRGKLLMTLVDKFKMSGHHSVTVDVGALPSGLYLYKLRGTSATKKMIVETF